MSLGMMIYLVDGAEIRGIAAGNKKELLALVRQRAAREIARLEEDLESEIEEVCPGFSLTQALREIFDGTLTQPECGVLYGHAFALICSSLGTWLSNRYFERAGGDWLPRFDQVLTSAGVGIQFDGGLVGRCPIPLPEPKDGFPEIGHWAAEEIRAALPRLERLLPQLSDEDVAGALEEVHDWLLEASAAPYGIIVGVYG
jgi:hypothetical protein